MRFRCESCAAQYAIADEKLGQKGVRVRCKKCGEIITVRPPQPEPEPEAGPQPEADVDAGGGLEPERESTAVESHPEGAAADGPDEAEVGGAADESLNLGEDDDLRDALDNILGGEDEGGGLDAGPDEEEEDADLDRQATRVFNIEEMQQVQAEREQAHGEDQPEPEPEADPGAAEPLGDETAGPPADVDRQRVEWYAAVDEEQIGPMSLDDFAERWHHGELDSDTLVWRSGFEDWLSVFEVPEFAFLAEEGPEADEADEADEEEEAAASEDWAAGAADWSPGMAAHAEPEDEDDRAAEEEWGAAAGGWYGDEDEDEGEEEDAFGEEGEASAAASAAAFAGTDVDWQPAALSSLSNLAEEELSSLRPEDPEPEEEDLPFGGDEQEGLGGDAVGEEMDDGDSSLIAQIAAEEEAAASQRAEQEQPDEEPPAEAAPRKEDEADLEAQAAASREKLEEQRERTAPPEERYIPPRSGLPRWAVGLMIGSGLVVLVLVGLLGYMLARSEPPTEPSTQPLAPPAGEQEQPADKPDEGGADEAVAAAESDKGAADDSGAAGAVGKDESDAAEEQAAGSDEADSDEAADDGSGDDEGADEGDDGDERLAAASGKPDRDKRRRRRRPRRNRRRAQKPKPRPTPRVAAKKPEPRRSEPEKPKRRKSKGGVLDFEDPDDQAFAAETGIAQPKPKKDEPKEKKLPPLSNADVLSVMKQHLAEFRACNRKQKRVDSSVRGKMVINFTIANNGKVSSSRISARTAQFKGTYVAKCIQGIIKRLKFPEFGGKPKKVPFPFTVN